MDQQTQRQTLNITIDDLRDKEQLAEKLSAMSEVDVQHIDLEDIVHYKNIVIDESLPKELRYAMYFLKVGNPFFFRTDNLKVKNVFDEKTKKTMHDCIVRVLISKMEQYQRDKGFE